MKIFFLFFLIYFPLFFSRLYNFHYYFFVFSIFPLYITCIFPSFFLNFITFSFFVFCLLFYSPFYSVVFPSFSFFVSLKFPSPLSPFFLNSLNIQFFSPIFILHSLFPFILAFFSIFLYRFVK